MLKITGHDDAIIGTTAPNVVWAIGVGLKISSSEHFLEERLSLCSHLGL